MKLRLVHPAVSEIACWIPGQGGLVIGRAGSAAVDLEINWDPKVSRRHARLWFAGDEAWFCDLASRNGSFLGERRLIEPIRLEPGMALRLGDTTLWAPEPDDLTQTLPGLDLLRFSDGAGAVDTSDVTEPADPLGIDQELDREIELTAPDRIRIRFLDSFALRTWSERDLVIGGTFLPMNAPPAAGRRLMVVLESPVATFELAAVVVHSIDIRHARLSGLPAGCGLAFEIGEIARRAMCRSLGELERSL